MWKRPEDVRGRRVAAGRRACAGLACLWIALAGCDRNVEPFDPEAEPREPDLSRIFPPGAGEASPGAEAAQMPASPRGVASPRGSDEEAADAEAAAIAGTVSLAQGLYPPDGAVLFVIARQAGVAGGPPLAVQRIPGAALPVAFSIGPEDVMIPSMRFDGEIQLTARLDGDGNAMTRTAGDLQGTAPGIARPGGRIDIVLDEQL